jgi:hypothetical protein
LEVQNPSEHYIFSFFAASHPLFNRSKLYILCFSVTSISCDIHCKS